MARVAPWLIVLALAGCARGEAPVATDDAPGPIDEPPGVIDEGATWRDDRVMVRPAAGASLDAIAAERGARAHVVGPSGWGAVEVPAGETVEALMAALRADARVAAVAAVGIVRGTSRGDGAKTERAHALQWHLDAIDAPAAGSVDLSDVVVAVLGSGVAYENHSDASGTYVQAPSFAGVRFVSPYDFVNDDAHANDDHQHGTHMASVIASIGEVEGVAAGATLMPVKILDANNSGDELALIDGIYHAVGNGADVINLSLSFSTSYVPSGALLDALDHAADAGVVLVAAAGNDGSITVTWPAASPRVIAVGGSQLVETGPQQLSDYTNRGPRLDLVAPAGDLLLDENGDGYVDGILAETIDPNDPTDVGLWLFAGTSSATAMTSGAAAHLLAAGATPDQVVEALHVGASPFPGRRFANGAGAGILQVDASIDALRRVDGQVGPYHVAMLPWLTRNGDEITPMAKVTVLDAALEPASGMTVYGTIAGEGGGVFQCRTSGCGECTVTGPAVSAVDEDGAQRALGWVFRAEALPEGSSVSRPRSAIFLNDKLEIVTAAMELDSRLSSSVLAFGWTDIDDPELGQLAAGYTVVDLAAHVDAGPTAIALTEAAVATLGTTETYDDVDLDGSGLASIPLGSGQFKGVDIKAPFTRMKLGSIDGTGLGSTLLDFRAIEVFRSSGSGQCHGEPVLLSSGDGDPGTGWTSDVIGAGGWINADGYAGASLMSSVAGVEAPVSSMGVSVAGGVPLD